MISIGRAWREVRRFGVALRRDVSRGAWAGLVIGPAILVLWNGYRVSRDWLGSEASGLEAYGFALRLHVAGHKLSMILVLGLALWAFVRIRDLFAWLLWAGALAMVLWSATEFGLCAMFKNPIDKSIIDAWGSGVQSRCGDLHPFAPFVPWAFFVPAFGYLVVRFGAVVWRRR